MTVKLPFDLKTFFLGDVQENWIGAARCSLSPYGRERVGSDVLQICRKSDPYKKF